MLVFTIVLGIEFTVTFPLLYILDWKLTDLLFSSF